MSNCFILLAAGKGKRFKSKLPKQLINYRGKPLFQHSIDIALKSKIFDKIILVTNKKLKIIDKKIIQIKGGRERFESSYKALKFLKNKKVKNVFIHDAARPNFSINLLKKLKKQLTRNNAVVPYTQTDSSVKYFNKKKYENLIREKIFLTQTPQCFNFKKLFELSSKNTKPVTDEASLFLEKGLKVKFIMGEDKNIKITTKKDLINKINTFYGIGFDIHRLIKNKKLYLGGIKIPFHSGLKGHSDGDVIIHAIIDGLLGAMRKRDIGTFFPDNRNKFKNIRSPKMLKSILNMLHANKFYINNVDINLICEKPKVSKCRDKIINSLSKLLNIDKRIINLKGKTVEKLGLIGKEKAIACEVICSISK